MAKRRIIGPLITGLVTAALFAAVLAIWFSAPPEAPNADQQPPEALIAGEFSVAVLPILVAQNTPVTADVAADLTRRVVRALREMPDIRVSTASETSAFALEARRPIVGEIAIALGVRYVFQAVIEGDQDNVQVKGHLADGMTGFVLWSGTYWTQPDAVLDLYIKLTEAIWDEFDLEFSGLL